MNNLVSDLSISLVVLGGLAVLIGGRRIGAQLVAAGIAAAVFLPILLCHVAALRPYLPWLAVALVELDESGTPKRPGIVR